MQSLPIFPILAHLPAHFFKLPTTARPSKLIRAFRKHSSKSLQNYFQRSLLRLSIIYVSFPCASMQKGSSSYSNWISHHRGKLCLECVVWCVPLKEEITVKFMLNSCAGDVTFHKVATELSIYLVGFSADWLTNSLALSLTYSITAKTMGLIFALCDVTSSRVVHTHHCTTFVLLKTPLYPVPFCWQCKVLIVQ